MEESLDKLNFEIKSLRIKLENEISKNKNLEETLYNITKQLHLIQDFCLNVEEEIKLIKLEKKSILEELDLELQHKAHLENFCKEQSIEIERGLILINNYLKIK